MINNWLEHAVRHNIEEIITEDELRKKIAFGKKLRIKFGVDVTNPLIHIGHAVNLWKMREFQDQGHKVVFLIGDFTTLIGDPTGKTKTRPIRNVEEIEKDAKEYISQVTKILLDDPGVFEVRRNSEWFGKMNLGEFMKLCMKITHARLIKREMFQKRIEQNSDIYMHEMLYPILQGYDSYMLQSDLTIIGSDQLFNELLGRHYQEVFGQEPQVVMTTVITPGTNGKEKMSKSLGNFIAILDSPEEKFGKIMTLPDELIITYYKIYTQIDPANIAKYEKQLTEGINPRDIKLNLAHDLVALYHGATVAEKTKANFLRVFSKKEKPEAMPRLDVASSSSVIEALRVSGVSSSNTTARELIRQGGVKLDGRVVNDPDESIGNSSVLQVGKRKFFKLTN